MMTKTDELQSTASGRENVCVCVCVCVCARARDKVIAVLNVFIDDEENAVPNVFAIPLPTSISTNNK